MRETTVGTLRGHTLENKKLFYEEVKKCKFQYFVIESFNHENRVGDVLLRELIEKGEDMSNAVGGLGEYCREGASGLAYSYWNEEVPRVRCKARDIRNRSDVLQSGLRDVQHD